MDVSIIIVNYNTPEMVIDCINSVQAQTKEISYEIIVVDNGSQDDSLDIFGDKISEAAIIINAGENLGFGKANNLGAKYAQGKYLLLLNSDTLLVNNAIRLLMEFLTDHSDVGVVGGNLYTINMTASSSFCMSFDDVDSVKRDSNWRPILNKIIKNRRIDRIADKELRDREIFAENFNFSGSPQKVAYVFGTDMFLRRELFEKAGGFDPEFFMYAEEEELSARITDMGYEIWSVPEAQIIHFDGGTFKNKDEFSERQYRMRLNGAFIYYKKRFGLDGAQKYYYYKRKKLHRLIYLARLFRRQALFSLSEGQLRCLESAYREFIGVNGAEV
ncbi:MAG: glycosyltransferase family 2 protein [Lachnospiraceae bacterium]|nr:glycosyltransferase family 2 protein [Lachnospiraceae bacterium]